MPNTVSIRVQLLLKGRHFFCLGRLSLLHLPSVAGGDEDGVDDW
jgi:hypothetical protein